MLGKLRNFSKSKLAGVLVVIIIIPFVFWGMWSVFSGGNKNNLAIINGENISSQDFIDYVNNSNIDIKTLKDNIENNVLEELLSQLNDDKGKLIGYLFVGLIIGRIYEKFINTKKKIFKKFK